jgi:hypothetical protein
MFKLNNVRVDQEQDCITCEVLNDVLPDHPVVEAVLDIHGGDFTLVHPPTGLELDSAALTKEQMDWAQGELLQAIIDTPEYQSAY